MFDLKIGFLVQNCVFCQLEWYGIVKFCQNMKNHVDRQNLAFLYGGVSFVLLSGRSHHGAHHPTVAKKGGAVVLRVVLVIVEVVASHYLY